MADYNSYDNSYSAPNCAYSTPQPPPPPPPPPPSRRAGCGWIVCVLLLVFVILPVAVVLAFLAGVGTGCVESMGEIESSYLDLKETPVQDSEAEDCDNDIAIVNIHGIIANGVGYGMEMNAADIKAVIHELAQRDISALILDMDTPGGEIVATDEIYSELQALEVPVVVCMRSMCASGGYYLAAAADYIVANRLTFTGSIGVILPTVNYAELLNKIGVSIDPVKSGAMKDMLSGARPALPAERAYVQQMIDESFHEFATIVSQGRNKAFPTPEDVKKSEIGDGRVVMGAHALELGLVDEIGDLDTAIAKAKELAGIKDANVTRYSKKVSFLDEVLSIKAPAAFNIRSQLPVSCPQLKAGVPYFLAPVAAGM